MVTRPHLVIGTPCYGGLVSSVFTTALLQLQQACAAQAIGFDVLLMGGDALVTRARNFIATEFLSRDHATHLMFIDADIGFEAEAVLRLLAFDADLSGGLYPLKDIDWDRIRRVVEKGGDPRAGALHYVAGLQPPDRIRRQGQFATACTIGTGFMLIKRRVLERMKDHYPALKFRRVHHNPDPQADNPHRFAFFDTMIDSEGVYLPEDYAFCRRWVDMGGEIWVDLNSQLTHQGPYGFVGNTSHFLSIFSEPVAPGLDAEATGAIKSCPSGAE